MDINHLISQYGYAALIVGSMAEGETITLLGGVAAHQGLLKFPLVVIAVALHALTAALVWTDNGAGLNSRDLYFGNGDAAYSVERFGDEFTSMDDDAVHVKCKKPLLDSTATFVGADGLPCSGAGVVRKSMYGCECDRPAPSITCTVKVASVAAVHVPMIRPDASRLSPSGNDPDTSDHVRVPVPPLAASVARGESVV